jgi:platelet-activating factor acetylhydrolase IB subunit alpha
MSKLSSKDLEIGKAVVEWITNLGFNSTASSLSSDLGLTSSDIPKTKVLEKKWTTILMLQKKVSDLESQIKTMKDDIESASISGTNYKAKKDTDVSSMVRILIIYML